MSWRAHQVPDRSGVAVTGVSYQGTNVLVVVATHIGKSTHLVTKQIFKPASVRPDLAFRQFRCNGRQDHVVPRVAPYLKATAKPYDIRRRHDRPAFRIRTWNVERASYAVLV
jgi:hypothetical protein